MTSGSPWIFDAETATFEQEVIGRSLDFPVIVDFWVTSCGPCKQLTPILEKLIGEFGGKVLLAKVNVDLHQDLAMAFGVQSIPHVFALRDGRAVDQFVGLLPEAQIRQWMEALLPSPAESLLIEGRALEQSDPSAATAKYREALALEPNWDEIKVHLARVLAAQQLDDECEQLIVELEKRGFLEPELEKIKAELEFRTVSVDVGGVEEIRQKAAADPDNLELQLELADALAAVRQYEEALTICLGVVQRDFGDLRNKSRETMVNIFHLVGDNSTIANDFRRRLATALY